MAFDVGLSLRYPATVFICVAAEEMNGQECDMALLSHPLPRVSRCLRRVDAVGDHAMAQSQVVRGNAVRDDIAFRAQRGRESHAQKCLLNRVDTHVNGG